MKDNISFRHIPNIWRETWGDSFDIGDQDSFGSNVEGNSELVLLCEGESEGGRPLKVWQWGHGPKKVSLLAGCHSDEPLGPHLLRGWLKRCEKDADHFAQLLDQFTFYICPHINPDGEARNKDWIRKYPDFQSYLAGAFRELPGRDLEFGFPAMRKENSFWTEALRGEGPFDLHMSLHGMGYSEGFLLLIEKHVEERCSDLKQGYRKLASNFGVGLHDHDRKGDKGFRYYGPGFSSTPEGEAMKRHFLSEGDPETASKFHLSSMEWIRELGGDPICLVSELPLFLIRRGPEDQVSGIPSQHLALRKALREGQDAIHDDFEIEPLGVEIGRLAMLSLIDMALESVVREPKT